MLDAVERVLSKLPEYKSSILIVDDRSPDGTGELVREFMKESPNVFLLSGPKKGLGKAIVRGIKYATSKLHADIIVTNEADFSYSPKSVVPMIRIIEKGADAVFGSRKLSDINTWPKSRKIVHFLANTVFAKYVAGITEIEDHNSAFKVIHVKGVLDKMDFSHFPKGYAFFNYFTFKIMRQTSNIIEFKTTFRPRSVGESKISFKLRNLKGFINEMTEYILTCCQIRFEKTIFG